MSTEICHQVTESFGATLGETKMSESVKDQQIRVDGVTANEMVIEAKTQRTTIKALIEQL